MPSTKVSTIKHLHRFAAGKGSALVIDVGQSMASVTPVVDGFVLRKGIIYITSPGRIYVDTHMLRPFVFAPTYPHTCSCSPYTHDADSASARHRANISPVDRKQNCKSYSQATMISLIGCVLLACRAQCTTKIYIS